MDIRFPVSRCTICSAPLNPELPPMRHSEFPGRVCHDCGGEHLPRAACALAAAQILTPFHGTKNSQPKNATSHE